MVFRKESKVDAFQRQISALRQQLGSEDEVADHEDEPRSYANEGHRAAPEPESYAPASYQSRDVSGYSFTSQVADYQNDDYEDAPSSELSIPTPTVDAQTSVVAHDTTWNGDLQSSGSLHVHGVVDGSLTAADDVYVAEEADVTATITATNVIVAGIVRGTIRCGSRFEVLPRGRVLADVQAPTLIVHEGGSITGQVRMGTAEPSAMPEQPAQPVVHRRAARNRA
jgi:cytoskeletal protein CcmA (bactofilin family)